MNSQAMNSPKWHQVQTSRWFEIKHKEALRLLKYSVGECEFVEIFVGETHCSSLICPIGSAVSPLYISIDNWKDFSHLIKRLNAIGCAIVGFGEQDANILRR